VISYPSCPQECPPTHADSCGARPLLAPTGERMAFYTSSPTAARMARLARLGLPASFPGCLNKTCSCVRRQDHGRIAVTLAIALRGFD
jgi:hypothetical protein